MYKRFIKRFLDIVLSALGLILLFPVLFVIAILIKVKLGGPVIFTQPRPGKNEKIFKLYKFRSMTNEKDEDGNLLPDDVRLTNFGKKLRNTSLDELPELWNILKGDMSFIGPRPLLVQYLPYYDEREKHRHDVRPGLTGYSQVNGRNSVSWEEKFNMDIYYVNNVSFVLDLKVINDTIKVVIKGNDVDTVAEAFDEYRKRQIIER